MTAHYVVTGGGPWLEWYAEVATLDEAKAIAAEKLWQGEIATVYDIVTNKVVAEYALRYDGMGVA